MKNEESEIRIKVQRWVRDGFHHHRIIEQLRAEYIMRAVEVLGAEGMESLDQLPFCQKATVDCATREKAEERISELLEKSSDDLEILKKVSQWREGAMHPERLRIELETLYLIRRIERLGGGESTAPQGPTTESGVEVPPNIRDRMTEWIALGWHPDTIMRELEAELTISKIENLKNVERLKTQQMTKRPFRGRKLDPKKLEKKEYLTPSEAAVLLGGSADTIKRDCQAAKIEPRRTGGGHWMLSKQDIQKLKRYRSEL